MLKENDILVCLNGRSLIAHKDEIAIQLFKEMDPLIVALTETRIMEVVEDKEISITGYTTVRCDSETKNTGGVILYIKDMINYKILFTRKHYWCIAIWMNDRKHYKDSSSSVSLAERVCTIYNRTRRRTKYYVRMYKNWRL